MKRCILCLAALSLAACGASGPLYLPGHEKHKSGILSKEQRKTGATPESPAAAPPNSPADAPAAAQPPAAPDTGSAPKPDASPAPAPVAPPSANSEPAPPQP